MTTARATRLRCRRRVAVFRTTFVVIVVVVIVGVVIVVVVVVVVVVAAAVAAAAAVVVVVVVVTVAAAVAVVVVVPGDAFLFLGFVLVGRHLMEGPAHAAEPPQTQLGSDGNSNSGLALHAEG